MMPEDTVRSVVVTIPINPPFFQFSHFLPAHLLSEIRDNLFFEGVLLNPCRSRSKELHMSRFAHVVTVQAQKKRIPSNDLENASLP